MDLVSWAAEPAGSSAPSRWGRSSAPGQGGSRRQQNSAASGDMEMWWTAVFTGLCQTPPAGRNGPCKGLSLLNCSLHETMDHSARESWHGDILHRQAELWEPDCSVAALLPPLLGELTEPSPSLLQGPNFWAVTGAGFWKSRALSQLLPS